MKAALIDTNILSLFLRGHPLVVANVARYLTEYPCLTFSVINYYEIVSGLAHRDAHKQMETFVAFAQQCDILPMTTVIAEKTAALYATLRKQGTPVDDIDLLIAGTALSHNLVMVTNNRKHFDRIPSLEVEDWSSE